jgi:hypothetical protein
LTSDGAGVLIERMTPRLVHGSAGLSVAVAVLVGSVAPLVCLCAQDQREPSSPACHAASAPTTGQIESLSAPCCCQGSSHRAEIAVRSDERSSAPFAGAAAASTISLLHGDSTSRTPVAVVLAPTHSPPGARTPLRI